MKPLNQFLIFTFASFAALLIAGCCCAHASNSPAAATSGYELGKLRGYDDGVSGRSRTPDRYETEYSEADEKEFSRGYEDGYNAGIKPGAKPLEPKAPAQPLTVLVGKGTVTVMEGKKARAVCHTESANIEETRFIREQDQLVVKSRGNHGPATVQLFDTSTGDQLGKVMAYEIRNGKFPWAAGMEE